MLLKIFLFINLIICIKSMVINDIDTDDSQIISRSKNLTVHLNETVHLPCRVRKNSHTIVIWNQCEDPNCSLLRNLLIVNKENFVSDMRFRVLNDNYNGETDSNSNHENWNLEIRKFGKNDEACYQCQLNSFRTKTIHYCLKLQTKVAAKANKISVHFNQPLKLQCSSDEQVRHHNINWYRYKEKLSDESENHKIERHTKSNNNNQAYTSLSIKKTSLEDAGVYFCRFGQFHDKIHVDVISSESNLDKLSAPSDNKNVKLKSNENDASNSYLSINKSSVVQNAINALNINKMSSSASILENNFNDTIYDAEELAKNKRGAVKVYNYLEDFKNGEKSGSVYISDYEHSNHPNEEISVTVPLKRNLIKENIQPPTDNQIQHIINSVSKDSNKNCSFSDFKKWCEDHLQIPDEEDPVFVEKFE
ncbi:unnamed protein product [Brachionus calyciflorus]|uniref:Ig-like domain-containing protein n=1 Tax=Brachionus calyciflorus TaxID=104777 RepID=A0A813U5W6_9BILA|nr:unnamed protein product [Brachionus calyciflorus]